MQVFGDIPNELYLAEVNNAGALNLLNNDLIKINGLTPYANRILSFTSKIGSIPDSEIIKTLFDDRANIIMGLNHITLNENYDKFLGNNKKCNSPMINMTYFPLELENAPEQNISNILDRLCIELDYMNYLCNQEQMKRAQGIAVIDTIKIEADFIREDLGDRANKFTYEAKKYSSTEYYGGFLDLLSGYVSTDLEYLNNLLLSY
jgi:hypothetical protein